MKLYVTCFSQTWVSNESTEAQFVPHETWQNKRLCLPGQGMQLCRLESDQFNERQPRESSLFRYYAVQKSALKHLYALKSNEIMVSWQCSSKLQIMKLKLVGLFGHWSEHVAWPSMLVGCFSVVVVCWSSLVKVHHIGPGGKRPRWRACFMLMLYWTSWWWWWLMMMVNDD